MKLFSSLLLGLVLCLVGVAQAEYEQIYRMCVPQKYYESCLSLLKSSTRADIKLECVAGRDRIDCLDQVNNRKADVLAGEPEEMYVAYRNQNENYRVIAEIRCNGDEKNSKITGYIAHADVVNTDEKMHCLQQSLQHFFENGQHAENKVAAAHLLINENAIYHSMPQALQPKQYLEQAGYRELIERDDNAIGKLKWCVQTAVELSKCNDIRRAAYSRDIRPEIECVQQQNCIIAVQQNQTDFAVVKPTLLKNARAAKLQPIMVEDYLKDNVIVGVVEPSLNGEALQAATITFNQQQQPHLISAIFLNKARGWKNYCNANSSSDGQIRILHSYDLQPYKNQQLLCANLEKRPIDDAANCNLDFGMPPAVVVAESKTSVQKQIIRHLFAALSQKFGANASHEDVYQFFTGSLKQEFIIFDNDGIGFIAVDDGDLVPNEKYFNELYNCHSEQDVNSIINQK